MRVANLFFLLFARIHGPRKLIQKVKEQTDRLVILSNLLEKRTGLEQTNNSKSATLTNSIK